MQQEQLPNEKRLFIVDGRLGDRTATYRRFNVGTERNLGPFTLTRLESGKENMWLVEIRYDGCVFQQQGYYQGESRITLPCEGGVYVVKFILGGRVSKRVARVDWQPKFGWCY